MSAAERPGDDDARWTLAAGALYLTAIILDQYVLRWLIGGVDVSLTELRTDGGRLILASLATRLFGVGLFATLIGLRSRGTLRQALRGERWTSIAIAVLLTSVVAYILNATELWPFAWRWNYDQNIGLVQNLVAGGHVVALAGWLLVHGVAAPIIEEVFIRFGVLQSLRRWSHSDLAAVVGSALLFGMLHLGYPPWQPDLAHRWNSIGAFVFGIVVGSIALRRDGRIALPIAIHVTVNVLSVTSLMVSAL